MIKNELPDNSHWRSTRIKSYLGTRLRAYPWGHVDATTNKQEWEQWKWIWIGSENYLIISYFGSFLGAHPNLKVYLTHGIPNTW
jgi:hypothetical protein